MNDDYATILNIMIEQSRSHQETSLKEIARENQIALTTLVVWIRKNPQKIKFKLNNKKEIKHFIIDNIFQIKDIATHPQKSSIYNKIKILFYVLTTYKDDFKQCSENISDIQNLVEKIFTDNISLNNLIKRARVKKASVEEAKAEKMRQYILKADVANKIKILQECIIQLSEQKSEVVTPADN